MKSALPILFLIIFLGCKNVNQEVVQTQRMEAYLYPVDSSLFETPAKKDSMIAFTYRGDFNYKVDNIDLAEKKINEMIVAVYFCDLESRNEIVTNGVLQKHYSYKVLTQDFIAIEKKLGSVLERAVSKSVYKNDLMDYDLTKQNLNEAQQEYKMYVAIYNNINTPFQEKNTLLEKIKECARNIKNMQSMINVRSASFSSLSINLSAKL